MDSAFDASNTTLPGTFTWTWTANIEQPTLTLTSSDVADGATIKKNEIDMLLTTPNSKLYLHQSLKRIFRLQMVSL